MIRWECFKYVLQTGVFLTLLSPHELRFADIALYTASVLLWERRSRHVGIEQQVAGWVCKKRDNLPKRRMQHGTSLVSRKVMKDTPSGEGAITVLVHQSDRFCRSFFGQWSVRVSLFILLASLSNVLVAPEVIFGSQLSSGERVALGQDEGPPPAAGYSSMLAQLEEEIAKGESKQVDESLAQFLRSPQLDSQVLLRVGVELARHEFYAEAVRSFSRCARDSPRQFQCSYNLALSDFAIRKYPEALKALKDASVGSLTQDLRRRYLRGKIEEASRESIKAERDLASAFAGAPQEEDYALDLGLFYIRRGEYYQARNVFKRGIIYNPRSPFLQLSLALSQFLVGRTSQSAETCRKLLNQDPGFSTARLLMGFSLYLSSQFSKAESVSTAGLKAAHPDPYLYYLHAAALLKLHSNQYNRMLEDMTIATHAIPDCALCYVGRSKIYQLQGNLSGALQDLRKAVLIDPDFSEAWYHLARIYTQTGHHADAIRAQERFESLKARKAHSEREVIRNQFLKALSGGERAASTPR